MPESAKCQWRIAKRSRRSPVGCVLRAVTLWAAVFVSGAPVEAAQPFQGAQPSCGKYPATAPAVKRLRDAMAHGRIHRIPTHFPASHQRAIDARRSAEYSRRPAGVRPRFDSLITYGSISGAEAIPEIAASLGFRAVVIGIWNPFNATGRAAITTARDNPTVVVGLSLGNEMLFLVHGCRPCEVARHRPCAGATTGSRDHGTVSNVRNTGGRAHSATPRLPATHRASHFSAVVSDGVGWQRCAVRCECGAGFSREFAADDSGEGDRDTYGTGGKRLYGEAASIVLRGITAPLSARRGQGQRRRRPQRHPAIAPSPTSQRSMPLGV